MTEKAKLPPRPGPAAVPKPGPPRAPNRTAGSAPPQPRLALDTYVPDAVVVARIPPASRHAGALASESNHLAVLKGHDSEGRAVVRAANGQDLHVDWSALSPAPGRSAKVVAGNAGAVDDELLFEGLGSDCFHVAPRKLVDAVKRALERPIVDGRTGWDVFSALRADGHQVLPVGGAIRDPLQSLADDPEVPVATLAGQAADLDFVTTALPSQVRDVVQRLFPERIGGVVWSPASIDRVGIVGIGQRHLGLDIASVRAELPKGNEAILGRSLAQDASARDFTMNKLYLDVERGCLVDPTGYGLKDAQQRLLRVDPKTFLDNGPLSMRYLKFRVRGHQPADDTRMLMKEHAERLWPVQSANPATFARNLSRILPAGMKSEADRLEYVGALRHVMQEEGMAELFEDYILPALPEAFEILSRQ